MRKSHLLPGLSLAAMVFVGIALVAVNISDLADRTDGRFRRIGMRLDRSEVVDAAFVARIESLDEHLAGSVRISHDRRAALADELRRETVAAVAKEAGARESDVAELAAVGIAVEGRIARLADVDRRLLGRIDALEKRLKAAESRPVPAPVIIEKTVQVPVVVPAPTPVYLYPIVPRRCR